MADTELIKNLVRSYYFSEALAFYELYYRPLVETYGPARQSLIDPGRQADRPPTWVPLVFHCTRVDRLAKILESGELRPSDESGALSFSEAPLGELDRLKFRHGGEDQIALAFPRRVLSTFEYAPVLYGKHSKELRETLRSIQDHTPELYKKLAPFIEDDDDVSPFYELRTTSPVSLEHAVWILTTKRNKAGRPEVPGLQEFKKRFGRIASSYWHMTHQMGLLGEWQYLSLVESASGDLVDFHFVGEHYWRQDVTRRATLEVRLPVHSRRVDFSFVVPQGSAARTGPWGFIDVARILFERLGRMVGSIDGVLPHRLVKEFPLVDPGAAQWSSKAGQ